MYSRKLSCLLVILAVHLTLTNAQFGRPGFGGGFGGGFGSGFSAAGGGANFANQNTNFNQNTNTAFGTIASFGRRGSSTNFQQSSNQGGIGGFGINSGGFGGFREDENDLEKEEMEMRYATPYDTPVYVPKKAAGYPPKAYPAPAPAPYVVPKTYASPPPAPVQCPQNLLIGCAPQVQYVPCAPPPPPPPPYGAY
ncbi:dnaJ homolog subfamily B member 6-like [Sitodiplosis mosellana]|uniref:dnaJ homolog subfamily B member 6-like n=1 Tax=Sitodiplosis mosellana TaxID=263140 RepID=UPI0024438792|nr:dnaJ homolog subfamily B member 6-like [Sitodiplosis mosellana]